MKKDDKIKIIKKIILDYYEVSEEDCMKNSRKLEYVRIRHLMLYILRYELGLTFKDLSAILNKDYSTLIRNFQTITNEIIVNKALQYDVREIRKTIKEEIPVNYV